MFGSDNRTTNFVQLFDGVLWRHDVPHSSVSNHYELVIITQRYRGNEWVGYDVRKEVCATNLACANSCAADFAVL
jgi:hypothetical protein